MDLNHDYRGNEAFLLTGVPERLQACKCAIMAFGDLGYTDPEIPSIWPFIGAYTDTPTSSALESKIREILLISGLARPNDILSIKVTSLEGADHFTVDLKLAFGSEVFDVPAVL